MKTVHMDGSTTFQDYAYSSTVSVSTELSTSQDDFTTFLKISPTSDMTSSYVESTTIEDDFTTATLSVEDMKTNATMSVSDMTTVLSAESTTLLDDSPSSTMSVIDITTERSAESSTHDDDLPTSSIVSPTSDMASSYVESSTIQGDVTTATIPVSDRTSALTVE